MKKILYLSSLIIMTMLAHSVFAAKANLTAKRHLVSEVDINGIGMQYYPQLNAIDPLIKAGKYQQAKLALSQLLAKFNLPVNNNTDYYCFSRAKQYQEFLHHYIEHAAASKPAPKRVSWIYCQALALNAFIAISEQRYDNAMSFTRDLKQLAPYGSQAYLADGYIYQQHQHLAKALANFQQALKNIKQHGGERDFQLMALGSIANIEFELKQYDKARQSLLEMIKLDPTNTVAKMMLKTLKQKQ